MTIIGPVAHAALGEIRTVSSVATGTIGVGNITVGTAFTGGSIGGAFIRTIKPYRFFNTELNMVAKTTISGALAIGGANVTVAEPYGFSAGDVVVMCDVSAGTAELLTVRKMKTNGSVNFAAGPLAAYTSGDLMLLFGTDKVGDQSDLSGADGGEIGSLEAAKLLAMLQDSLQHSKVLTATGGAAAINGNTIVDTAGTFVANAEIGNTVTIVFDTGGLDPENFSGVITANSNSTLTVGSIKNATGVSVDTWGNAPAAGDLYVITPNFLAPYINALADTSQNGVVDQNTAVWNEDTDMADPAIRLVPQTDAHNADVRAVLMAGLQHYIEQIATDPMSDYMAIDQGLPDNVHPTILASGTPVSGQRFVIATELAAAGTEVSLVVDPRVGSNHLPTSGAAILVKGPFSSETATATNEVGTDAVVIASRDGGIVTITGKDGVTAFPPGSYLIMNVGVPVGKKGYDASVPKTMILEQLRLAVLSLNSYRSPGILV